MWLSLIQFITTMSTKIELEIRRTFNYNAGWSHLDKWESLGTKRLIGKAKESNDGESYSGTLLYLVNSDASKEDIKEALLEGERHACTCEHDCCGHFFGSASNARNFPNSKMWAVKISGHMNI